MQKRRKSICIISFSHVDRDARILRQIQFLFQQFNLIVIGYGDVHSLHRSFPSVQFISVFAEEGNGRRSLATEAVRRALMHAGKLSGAGFERWYWGQARFKSALAAAIKTGCHAIHANDWEALPVAAAAAKQLCSRLVFDAHEYAPLEFENRPFWRWTYSPLIKYFLRKCAPFIDASTTVAPAIAERYQQEFGLKPIVILNAPDRVSLPLKTNRDFFTIRLVHHGLAIPDRRLEEMIKTIALCDRRFTLHLILTGNNAEYFTRLKSLAASLAPDRVEFHAPVAPREIVNRISGYDMGLCLIPPTNYNYSVCLPNKFFECIGAGLPVCIGPSPSMSEIVRKYQLGCIAPSFDPHDCAATLNRLTAAQLSDMSQGARAAADEMNAEHEMAKLVTLYQSLLN